MRPFLTMMAILVMVVGCRVLKRDTQAEETAARFFSLLGKTNREIRAEMPALVVVGTKANRYRRILEQAKSPRACDIGPILRLDRGEERDAGGAIPGTQYVYRIRGGDEEAFEGDGFVDIFVDDETRTVQLVRVLIVAH